MSLWLKKPSAVHGYLMQMKWWPPMRMKRRNSFIHFAEVKWAAVRVRYSERPWCDWEQQFQWLPENVEILKKDFHFKLCVCVCVCTLVLSVSNHSDPRVPWLGQGAGTQWRGCPTVAASFRCQSKSGMEREVDIAWKEVNAVVKADVGVLLCVCVCGLSGYVKDSESLVWYLFIIPKQYDTLSGRRTQCLFPQWLWPSLSPCGQRMDFVSLQWPTSL